MYGYVMFSLSVLLTVGGGIWIVTSFFKVGKVRCPKCKTTFNSFHKIARCPTCKVSFAKREGKTFRVVK